MAISRLAPQDYHRYHFSTDGTVTHITEVPGTYFTVNPMAVRDRTDVFTENKRTVAVIESPQFGKIVYVVVGAMMVGSILITAKVGSVIRR